MNPAPLNKKLLAAMLAACGASLIPSLRATSDAWTGTTDGLWATSSNWSTSPATVPGTGDTATFNAASSNSTINLGSGVTIGTVLFDTASAAAYTIGSGAVGSQTLTFDTAAAGNAITLNSTVTTAQTINANILANTADNTLRLVNSTSITTGPTLTINGTIQGGTGATARVVNTTGNVTLTGSITAGSAASIALANVSNGTLTLSGSGTSSLLTLTGNTAGGKVVVNGQTVTVANSSSFGSVSNSFEIQSGSVAFNGGLAVGTSSGQPVGADGQTFKVSGGTFSASTITMGRTTSSFTSLQTNPTITSGLIVTGGTANVTGNVRLAGSNSSATSLVSGGSLTVGGEFMISDSTAPNNGRWNIFQVSGGTFTNTDTTNGVVLSRNLNRGGLAEFLVTGGVSTVEKISFGLSTSATTGSTTSQGVLILGNATNGGSLYVGSGGLVQGALANYTTTVNLTNGTLGAKADWSSSLAMNLTGLTNGSAVSIKTADASNTSKNITLSGALSGTGGFTKTGGGTLTLSGANTYTGATIVNAGTLAYGNSFTMAGANQITLAATGTAGTNYATVTSTAGTLTFGGTLAINFSSSILSGNQSFNLFQASGGSLATGFSGVSVAGSYATTLTNNSGVWTGSANGFDFTFTESTGTLGVLASAVPEPATYATLAGLGILGFAAYRRRRVAA